MEGPQARASPASLPCGPLARHIYPSLVLVQPRKTPPCLTERLLMGRRESNQRHVLKGATIKGKNMLPNGEHILSFKSSPYEDRK